MEFLGINLSLAGWSYFLFATSILFYTNTAIASVNRPKLFGMILMIVSYLMLQIGTFIYAIATKQPGFLLTLLFQNILLFIMMSFHRSMTKDED